MGKQPNPAIEQAIDQVAEQTELHVDLVVFEEGAVLDPAGRLEFTVPVNVVGPIMLILEPFEKKWRPIVLPAGTHWRLAAADATPAAGLWRPGMPQ